MNGRYFPAEHHRLIAEKLEAVANGEIRRLRIHMPPRNGKSELASIRFPAWFLGTQPHRNIIATSYGSDLAGDFGRAVRNLVASPEYQRVFKTTLRDDSQAANRWHTDKGGMYVAAGVGSAITGRGAHILVIDDPFKNREEADSEPTREKVWRWYTSTAYTRLERDIEPGMLDDDELWHDLLDDIRSGDAKPFEGAIVGIGTRWHEDDWFGRVEKAELDGGEKWESVDLPAIINENEPDERALWPAKFPLDVLKEIRAAIGPRDWASLYQQKPAPDEGDYFQREWFNFYHQAELPKHLRIYGASDYAVSDGKGDWTVHLVVGVCPEDNIYIIDLWRGQSDASTWIEMLLSMVEQHNPMMWAEEKGVILKTVGPFLDRRMRERRVYFRREGLASVADKPARARSFQGRAAMGKVYLPHNAPWVAELMAELMRFPSDPDDQVDALGMIGRMLDTMVAGKVPKPPKKRRDPWDKAFAREEAGEMQDWRVL